MEAQSLEGPMRIGVVAVVGLMASVGAAVAQQAPVAQALQARVDMSSGTKCPGQLIAQRQPTTGTTVWTIALEDKDKKDAAYAAGSIGLHVLLAETKNPARSVELSVSYLPRGLRVTPVPEDAKNDQELKKSFVLSAEDGQRVEGDLLVGPAAATITRVHLSSVTFQDGSVWRAPDDAACSVKPSLYMPVEAKR